MGQRPDSHISDIQVIFSLAFRFQRNLKTELSALQICRILPGGCEGTHASAGCPKKERVGSNFPSSDALSRLYVYMSVPINYL